MPVQRLTTAAISSSVTSCFKRDFSPRFFLMRSSTSFNFFSSSGICPYRISATFCKSPWRSKRSASPFSSSNFSLSELNSSITLFSSCQRISIALASSRKSSMSLLTLSSRSFTSFASSFLSASRSISSCIIFRCNWSRSTGLLSSSIFKPEVASSIKSIALSGKYRSPI